MISRLGVALTILHYAFVLADMVAHQGDTSADNHRNPSRVVCNETGLYTENCELINADCG